MVSVISFFFLILEKLSILYLMKKQKTVFPYCIPDQCQKQSHELLEKQSIEKSHFSRVVHQVFQSGLDLLRREICLKMKLGNSKCITLFTHFQEIVDIQAAKTGSKVHLIMPPEFPKTIIGNENA